MAAVRPLREIRVYSPTQENREKLAAELRDTLKIKVVAAESAEAAVKGADIVGRGTTVSRP